MYIHTSFTSTFFPSIHLLEESSPNIGQNGGISETPANGIGAVTEDNISLDEHVTSRELLEEVPLHVETGAAPKKSSKRQKARSLSSSKGERRECLKGKLCIPYSRKGWRGIYFGVLAISVSTAKV